MEIKKTTKIISKSTPGAPEEKIEIIEKKEEKPFVKNKTELNVNRSSNVNDIINKINNNISNNKNNVVVEKSSFATNEVVKKEVKKIDDDKKNARLNKALLRAKKKQKNKNEESEGGTSLSKSDKVANLVKQLEDNMQKRDDNPDDNNNIVEEVEVTETVEKFLENQPLHQTIKKKKPGKKSLEDDE